MLQVPAIEPVSDQRAPAARADALAVVRPSSRADAVLAVTVLPQYADLTASPLSQLLHGDELTRTFEELQRRMNLASEDRRHVLASSIALTSGLSIGYVVWLVRGGVLVSSMLSALPAWQMVDPMPVLAAGGALQRRKPSMAPSGPEEPEVERLFGEAARAARAARSRPVTASAAAPAPASSAPTSAPKDQRTAPHEVRRDAIALQETPR
jgi:hypothetical protein